MTCGAARREPEERVAKPGAIGSWDVQILIPADNKLTAEHRQVQIPLEPIEVPAPSTRTIQVVRGLVLGPVVESAKSGNNLMLGSFHPSEPGVLDLVTAGAQGDQTLEPLDRTVGSGVEHPLFVTVRSGRPPIADGLFAADLAPVVGGGTYRDPQSIPNRPVHDAANVRTVCTWRQQI
ncbi:hypothetical protein NWFMUON74_09830 [Nocardia wallacei]|uniref:Uncharacterized protein n=1 Tax=Nocardia wallacei TaxID=480035 RepID=A0A7G1KE92_9NOCA|nr:hypothetical protein NWFMUON74_09830 [Nocardia wallacei]